MFKKVMIIIMAAMFMFSSVPINTGANGLSNIAINKSYTIESYVGNEYSYSSTEIGSKDMLTDGKKASSLAFYNGEWAHFVRGVGRYITVDLEKLYSISSFQLDFLQNADAGVYCPTNLECSVSEDGINYMTVSSLTNPVSSTKSPTVRAIYKYEFNKPYKARYVRFSFNTNVNSFIDEIEIFGGEITGNEASFVKTPNVEPKNNFGGREALPGAYDYVAFHLGYYGTNDPKTVNNTKDSFMPYLGYKSSGGSYTDTMFDGVVFFTLQGLTPSGGKMTTDGTPSVLSDWEYLLDNTFDPEYNLCALNEAANELKDILGLSENYTVPVYLSIPFPKISPIVFNDINADGVPNKISNIADMLKAQEWYLNEVFKLWADHDFDRLEFKGIFWCSESLESGHWEDFFEYTKQAVNLIQSKGLKLMYIPFYQAAGIDRLDEIGFDSVTMQPNLSFNIPLQENPEKMMEEFFDACYKYGMGMEMEISHRVLFGGDDKKIYGEFFMQYLRSASNSAIMTNAVHTYYQGAGPGVFHDLSKSSNTYDRYIYDCVYKFIKGTLSFPKYSIKTKEAAIRYKLPSIVKIEMEGDWFVEDFTFELTKNAANGNVSIMGKNGNFRFTPNDEFNGEDSFVVKVSCGDYSEEKEIRLFVETDESKDESSEEETIKNNKNFFSIKDNLLFFSGIGVAAAAAISMGIVGFIKKKNNKK